MIIYVEKTARELKIKDPDLLTRPVGRIMYSATMEKLLIIGAGEVVLLDFSGIKVVDSSFIDEYIVRLIHDSGTRDFYLKLRNISFISEINIDSVFNSFSNYKQRRIAVARGDMGSNNRFFIGPLTELEGDILDYLRINQGASTDEIAGFSGIKPSELKKILDELSFLRVIKQNNGEYTTV